jgi:hypothetical protein
VELISSLSVSSITIALRCGGSNICQILLVKSCDLLISKSIWQVSISGCLTNLVVIFYFSKTLKVLFQRFGKRLINF